MLKDEFDLKERPPFHGIKVLRVTLGDGVYEQMIVLAKFDVIDKTIRISSRAKKCRLAHNIYRATALACRMMHLKPPADSMALWHDFSNRQST